MRYTQQLFLNTFGNPAAMARVLEAICREWYSPAGATQLCELDMAAFLTALSQRGEAFLEVTLGDGCSALYLWARRDGATCQIQLTPSLQSRAELRRSWEDRYTSAVMLRTFNERPTARQRAA